MIMDKYPSLKGNELGYAIKTFKEKFENYNEFILDNNVDYIMTEFDNHLNNL